MEQFKHGVVDVKCNVDDSVVDEGIREPWVGLKDTKVVGDGMEAPLSVVEENIFYDPIDEVAMVDSC